MQNIISGTHKFPDCRRDMRILLDIEGTIPHTPQFFSQLSKLFIPVAEIHIATFRKLEKLKKQTISELEDYDIKYHQLSFIQNKKDYVDQQGINIVFGYNDESYIKMPPEIVCFKIRERDNFDWESMKWIYDNKTGVNIKDLI